jgi:hypothetical protein
MLRVGIILALAVVALPGTASAQETVRKKYERDVITREEIQDRAPDAKTAYDVIQRLRPQFLRTRQSGSITQSRVTIKVYVDGAARGTVNLAGAGGERDPAFCTSDGSDADAVRHQP